ncbi:uncharacterized protein LOC115210583 [Octopus sinensis]|uniref:Uncharacterized protein LOC115210583 n=1 Tax=Octopus sinensis TaxID=2607531 RepID=A0A7E6ET93_9MOLL|nr:uncharacterized protein LOC115210583 [Octopus sinensis]XP_036358560.1 uncharacterized protein LOC115210583 [Octopus sinensis]
MASGENEEKKNQFYISVPTLVIVIVVLTVLCVGSGVLLGYYLKLSPQTTNAAEFRNLIQVDDLELNKQKSCEKRDLKANVEAMSFLNRCKDESCKAVTCDLSIPRNYIVYRTAPKSIKVDGSLEETAWTEVHWTKPFVDIRGEDFPLPRFETQVKLRWDDTYLYVAARLQDTDVWANKTLHDTTVYQDNAFQLLLDTERSNHKYKEIVINALGTVSDSMISKPYLNDGEPLFLWESNLLRAVYIDGPVNNPKIPNKFWQVEMALPFKQLTAGTERSNDPPNDLDIWQANFVRSNWEVEVVGNKYEKKFNGDTDWWVWNSPEVSNIHLPNRWGLLQFRTVPVNSTIFQPDPYLPLQKTLSEIYEAEHAYKANTGKYTDDFRRLKLPPYVTSGQCMQKPRIKLDWGGFIASTKPLENNLNQLNIRTDRYMWIGEQT